MGKSGRHFKSLKHVYIVFLSIVGIALSTVYNSCQKSLPQNAADSGSRSCKVLGPGEVSKLDQPGEVQSVFKDKKLILPVADSSGFSLQKTSATALSDMRLVALIDNNCHRKNQFKFTKLLIGSNKVEERLSFQPYAFDFKAGDSLLELESRIESDPCVRGVSFERSYRPASVGTIFNDPVASYQQHLDAVSADLAYQRFYHSDYGIPRVEDPDPIKIAVIDTGVNYTHEDLQGAIWRHGDSNEYWGLNARSLGTGAIDYNSNDVSTAGHGTHVAGIIAATSNNGKGIASAMPYGAKVMAIKVFYRDTDDRLTTNTSIIASGVLWALDHGADVINLSLRSAMDSGSFDDPILQDLMIQALNSGAVVVTAAGNGSTEHPAQELTDTTFTVLPARYAHQYKGMLAVGSVDVSVSGQVTGRSSFSHYSTKYVEIAAPGQVVGQGGIYSTLPGSALSPQGSYGSLTGTSQSAPMVSAAAGLVMSLYKKHYGKRPSPSLVEQLILEGASKDALVSDVFRDGNVLNLDKLAIALHTRFPATNGGKGCP